MACDVLGLVGLLSIAIGCHALVVSCGAPLAWARPISVSDKSVRHRSGSLDMAVMCKNKPHHLLRILAKTRRPSRSLSASTERSLRSLDVVGYVANDVARAS
jgi:hypothetical protein